MLISINNISKNFGCMAVAIFMMLSCNNKQEQHQGAAKLVIETLPNGTTKVIGATIDGKKEGMWIEYDDSGRISLNYTYVNDSLLGEEISYWEDGKISTKRYLKGDEIQGEWVKYYDFDKNKIAQKGSYRNGNKIGVWEYYLEDGRLNKKVEYTDNGEKIILNNHLIPEVPDKKKPSPTDSNNRVFVTDSNDKEISHH